MNTQVMETPTPQGLNPVSPGASQVELVKLGNDYSRYFKPDITDEIARLEEFIEESLAKLEEFISLYEMNESETEGWMEMALPTLLHNASSLSDTFRQRLDTLASLTESLRVTMEKLEVQVSQAEAALGTASSFRSMLNYFRKPETQEASPKVPLEPISVNVDEFFTKVSLQE